MRFSFSNLFPIRIPGRLHFRTAQKTISKHCKPKVCTPPHIISQRYPMLCLLPKRTVLFLRLLAVGLLPQRLGLIQRYST